MKKTENHAAKPFLKWAGGKTQLLQAFEQRFPRELAEHRLHDYVEPFVGGGAVFFAINRKYGFKNAYICDRNEELVLAYRVVQAKADQLVDSLRTIETEYYGTPPGEQPALYYAIRDRFNRNKDTTDFMHFRSSWVRRAAELIFLNHTCFNGLFRVNSRGLFNVPFGSYKNPHILDEEVLLDASACLQNTTIIRGDFTACERYTGPGSFVYLDPPYRPLNRTSWFTGYSAGGFTDQDQVRLAEFFRSADRRGARVMLSNSDPKNEDPDDSFFDTLYSGYVVDRVFAKRAINSNGNRRGEISEIIVTNYPGLHPR